MAQVEASFGRYALLKKLAVGGMAEIFLAQRLSFGDFARFVVIKRLLPEHRGVPGYEKLFLEEARIAAALEHPNIVSVYDLGKLDDAYFMVMEYIHGVSGAEFLTRSVKTQSHCDVAATVAVISRIALALDHGLQVFGLDNHPMGVVHHDISPHNIQIGYDGSVKLLDYGVATQLGRHSATGRRGKFAYMSPEAARKRPADHRSDLFSLGIILYEMTVGRRLFKARSPELTMRRIREGHIRRPREVREDFPEALEEIILRSLNDDPTARFQTGVDFAAALQTFAQAEGLDTSEDALQRHLHSVFAEDIASRWNELVELASTFAQGELSWTSTHSVPATGEFEAMDDSDGTDERAVLNPDTVGRETIGVEPFGATPTPSRSAPPELLRIESDFLDGPGLDRVEPFELPDGVNDIDPDWAVPDAPQPPARLGWIATAIFVAAACIGLWGGYLVAQNDVAPQSANPGHMSGE